MDLWTIRQFTEGPDEGKFFLLSIVGYPVTNNDQTAIRIFDTIVDAQEYMLFMIERLNVMIKHLAELEPGESYHE